MNSDRASTVQSTLKVMFRVTSIKWEQRNTGQKKTSNHEAFKLAQISYQYVLRQSFTSNKSETSPSTDLLAGTGNHKRTQGGIGSFYKRLDFGSNCLLESRQTKSAQEDTSSMMNKKAIALTRYSS